MPLHSAAKNNTELPTKPERNAKGIDNHNLLILWIKHNARLRGRQRYYQLNA
ncbi:hypothetical protein VCHE09_3248 [Vibrio paracholerae HE-09]|nr:hypothetical protein VCHE09_3248 [Vibrio paracholerae HE-09]